MGLKPQKLSQAKLSVLIVISHRNVIRSLCVYIFKQLLLLLNIRNTVANVTGYILSYSVAFLCPDYLNYT